MSNNRVLALLILAVAPNPPTIVVQVKARVVAAVRIGDRTKGATSSRGGMFVIRSGRDPATGMPLRLVEFQ